MFFKKSHRPKPKHLTRLIDRTEKSGVGEVKNFRGCSKAEIKALEQKYDVKLPAVYTEYLRLMGYKSERLFTHDHLAVFYDYVIDVTQEFFDDVLAAEDDDGEPFFDAPKDFKLPDKALIISERLGTDWEFIICNDDVDSPVWWINENDWGITQVHASVLEWLNAMCLEAETAIDSGYFKSYPSGTTP